MTQTRLRAYLPNGADQGPLPTPSSLSAGWPLNDVGALQFDYAAEAPRSDLLGQPLEVGVEVSTDGGNTWAEPKGARFLYYRDGRDPVRGNAFSVECPNIVIRLKKGVVPFTGLSGDGLRVFSAATPGAILHTLMAEAQARGALTGLTWDFTATQDSSGLAWPSTISQSYAPGQDFLSILQGLADQGLVEYTTQGRTIQVYVADSATGMAQDKTTGTSPVSLRFGRDLTEAPFRRTWEGLADTAYVQGDSGANLVRTNATAVTPWGRQETFVTASGVEDAGTLQVVGDGSLEMTADARTEFTYGLDFAAATALPFRDYGTGNWVYASTDGNPPTRMRVRQVTLTRGTDGASAGNVVLNDRFLEADLRQQRRLDALLSGATQSGSGTLPAPVGPDILQPAAVASLAASSALYLDGRTQRAQVTLDWPDVTTNADGTAATDIVGYEIQRRLGTTGAWEAFARSDLSVHSSSPYDRGATWQFRVRALDGSNNWGGFSPVAQITTAQDTTGPSTPSTPTVTSPQAGQALVVWDGKATGGAAMSADTDHVEVHVGTPGFTPVLGDPTTLKNSWTTLDDASFPVNGLTEGANYHVRLLAVDTSGNQSTASAATAITISSAGGATPPPSAVPTPTVQGTIKGLKVSWPVAANAAGTRIEVHMSTTTGFTPTAGSAATLVATETGLSTTILKDAGGADLTPGVTYFVRLIAVNSAGTFGPSAEASGILRQVETADVSANAAWVGTMTVDHLVGGDMAADSILTGSLEAQGANGEAVGLSGADGFYVKGAIPAGGTADDRPVLVSFPTDSSKGNIITSQLTASTLLITGGATFRGSSAVEPAAKIVLGGRVIAPKNAPALTSTRTTSKPASTALAAAGLTRGHDAYWYAAGTNQNLVKWAIPVGGDIPANGSAATLVDLDALFPNDGYSYYLHGLVYSPTYSRYYVLYTRGGGNSPRVKVLNTAFAEVQDFTAFGSYGSRGFGAYGLGWDHTNNRPMWSRASTSGLWAVRYLTLDGAGAITGVTGDTDLAGTGDEVNADRGPKFVARGSFDVGADVIVAKAETGDSTFQAWSNTGTADTTRSWPSNDADVNGACWDPTTSRFYSWSKGGTFARYEGGESMWTAGSAKWWASYTWYDSSGNLHETSGSPFGSATLQKRARLSVTIDPIPTGAAGAEDPNSARIYVGKADAQPATTAMYLRATLTAASGLTAAVVTGVANGAALSAKAADFDLVTNPGRIESNGGGSYWAGDDTAKFLKLILDSTSDAGTGADAANGSEPALRVGNIAGTHLRIDGNELVAMTATGQGMFILNSGGPVTISGYCKTGVKNTGTLVANTDTTLTVNFPSAFPAGAPIPTVQLTATGIGSLANATAFVANNITRSGFQIVCRRASTTAYDIAWTAIAQ